MLYPCGLQVHRDASGIFARIFAEVEGARSHAQSYRGKYPGDLCGWATGMGYQFIRRISPCKLLVRRRFLCISRYYHDNSLLADEVGQEADHDCRFGRASGKRAWERPHGRSWDIYCWFLQSWNIPWRYYCQKGYKEGWGDQSQNER